MKDEQFEQRREIAQVHTPFQCRKESKRLGQSWLDCIQKEPVACFEKGHHLIMRNTQSDISSMPW